MDIFEAIRQRRSVKHYDSGHAMSAGEIDQLMSAVILSPTSFNMQNWRFVLVQDKQLREEIRKASWNQAQVTDASLLIILCADKNAWKDSHRYWSSAPEHVRDYLVRETEKFYQSDLQMQHDETMRSCGIAAQTLMLAAKSMGYDSCPMVGFDFKKVAELIHLPKDYVITMFVVVGKGIKLAHERGRQLSMKEVIIYDHFKK
ncbi:MAG: nitroreductase family protein [Candidatus Omnitrophica bacterium]|nr:nitroreductase family protein [Candidatus Omnitrophota bacterium]